MSSPKTVMLRMRRVLPSSTVTRTGWQSNWKKLGAGSLHDTESKMEEFKKQLLSEDFAKMKEKIQKAREKLQDKENMDPEDNKKDVSDLQ